MVLDKNGARIDMVTGGGPSILGDNYVVIWDETGAPIHIHKNVVEYLCVGMYGQNKAPVQDQSNQ